MTSQDNSQEMASAAAYPSTFPLLRLPIELRTLIYKFALVEPPLRSRRHQPGCVHRSSGPACFETPPSLLAEGFYHTWANCTCRRDQVFDPYWRCECYHRCACGKRQSLNLLLASRQVNYEASEVFWSSNIFSFENTSQLASDLDDPLRLGDGSDDSNRGRKRRRDLIRHIRIVGSGTTKFRYPGQPTAKLDRAADLTSLRTLEVHSAVLASQADCIYTLVDKLSSSSPKHNLNLTAVYAIWKCNHPSLPSPSSSSLNNNNDAKNTPISVFTHISRSIPLAPFQPCNTTLDNIKHVSNQIPGHMILILQNCLDGYLESLSSSSSSSSSAEQQDEKSQLQMARDANFSEASGFSFVSDDDVDADSSDSLLSKFRLEDRNTSTEDETGNRIWEIEILGTDNDSGAYNRWREELQQQQQRRQKQQQKPKGGNGTKRKRRMTGEQGDGDEEGGGGDDDDTGGAGGGDGFKIPTVQPTGGLGGFVMDMD